MYSVTTDASGLASLLQHIPHVAKNMPISGIEARVFGELRIHLQVFEEIIARHEMIRVGEAFGL